MPGLMRWLSLCFVALFAVSIGTGCGACMEHPDPKEGGLVPVEWSAYRLGKTEQMERPEVHIQFMTSRRECRSKLELSDEQAEDCVPTFDRSTGTSRVAFRFIDKTTADPILLPLEQDNVQVTHMGRGVVNYQLIPHDPQPTNQLFLLLIDGSGSMHKPSTEQGPVMKVYNALMDKKVIDSFFPPKSDVQRGVTLLKFTDKVHTFDGQEPKVITSRKEYKYVVQNYMLSGPRGWTYLYDAVKFTVKDMLEYPSINNWLTLNVAEPTVIALTDGFNNQENADSCGTNAKRLQVTLEAISQARNAPLGLRPTLYTVGLGKPIRPGWEAPGNNSFVVSPNKLCGKFKDSQINGALENMGIDNPSMTWMAKVGGGQSFTKNSHKGLAQVFRAAAAERYRWYEVWYSVDAFFHRKTFKTEVKLQAFARGGAGLEVHPSSFFDAPTAERVQGAKWPHVAPYRRTFTLMMPILSLLVIIAFWGPASFNARRAVFRRSVASSVPTPPAGAPPQDPGAAPPGDPAAAAAAPPGGQPPPAG